MRPIRSLVLIAFAGLPALPLGAQGRQVKLGAAQARAAEPLSLVTRVRELRGGEVLVADPIERKVLLFDARLGSTRSLGREGSGPGEYRQPDAVFPFVAESSLVVDLGNARLSIVGPDGKFGRSLPIAGGASGGPPSIILPGGTDARGGIYFTAPPGSLGPIDSTDVLRVDAQGAGRRPLARIKTPDIDRQESGSSDARQVMMRPVPLSASDGWAVTGAGELAVVRSGSYRVEWTGGPAARAGKAVDVVRIRIGEAEKKEWVQQQMLTGGIGIQIQEENGRRSMSFGRQRPSTEPSTEGYKWPAAKPPFDPASLRVDGKGRLWVRRTRPAGEAPLYDVFGADGNLVSSVAFPARRSLIGFGSSSLYAVEVDDDGQYTLERYALPL